MESVLVGVDRSEACRRAVQFALSRARINDWRVTVVHVINWSKFSWNTLEENQQRPVTRKKELKQAQKFVIDPLLDWAGEQGLTDGVPVETEIHFGHPYEVINDLAVEGGYDAVVVARTGESRLKEAIFGSTASRLVQHSAIPVVVVP